MQRMHAALSGGPRRQRKRHLADALRENGVTECHAGIGRSDRVSLDWLIEDPAQHSRPLRLRPAIGAPDGESGPATGPLAAFACSHGLLSLANCQA